MNCYRQLSRDERTIIAWLRQKRWSLCEIARELGRSPSTISREVRRNCARHDGAYRAEPAQRRVNARRRKSREGMHCSDAELALITELLKYKWSPEQISATLRTTGMVSISHETIYRFIRADRSRGGSLYKHLRIMPKRRRKHYRSTDYRGRLQGKRHISERPAEVETRTTFGHWEADTVVGSNLHHCILTLVERKSGFAIIKKMNRRSASCVTDATLAVLRDHPTLFTTITLDNGTEFHGYKRWEQCFPVSCYFATPYHSWERGSNENLNGLIRQYLPRPTSMETVTQKHCDWIARQLNTRPRKRLGFSTPQEVLHAAA